MISRKILTEVLEKALSTGADFADLSFIEALPNRAAVLDAVYAPPETSLLKKARATGHPAANGMGMLIHQAILALEQLTGIKIDAAEMRRLVERVLQPLC